MKKEFKTFKTLYARDKKLAAEVAKVLGYKMYQIDFCATVTEYNKKATDLINRGIDSLEVGKEVTLREFKDILIKLAGKKGIPATPRARRPGSGWAGGWSLLDFDRVAKRLKTLKAVTYDHGKIIRIN